MKETPVPFLRRPEAPSPGWLTMPMTGRKLRLGSGAGHLGEKGKAASDSGSVGSMMMLDCALTEANSMDKEIRSTIHKKLQRRLVEDDGEFEHAAKKMLLGMVVDCLKKNRSRAGKSLKGGRMSNLIIESDNDTNFFWFFFWWGVGNGNQ